MRRAGAFFRRLRDERGLALVSVLWALSILSLIAAAMMSSSILSYRMERNDWRRLQNDTLADFAIHRAILGLTDARLERRWRVDGVPQGLNVDGAHVTVRVQDEFGKIDLNAADNDMLRRLFLSAGASADQADAITNRIVDWRTPPDEKNPDNSNQARRVLAKPGYRARNSPFQSVDELKLVLGITPALFARIEPALTVYSKRGDINEKVAPKEALLALPDMDEEKANAVIAARAGHAELLTDETNGTTPEVLNPVALSNGRVFSITADVVFAKQHAVLDAVVELTGETKRPYLVLGWK